MAETAVAPKAAEPGELGTLDSLVTTLKENVADERLLVRRIAQFRAGRAKGRSWHDLLAREKRPGALELVGRILRRLTEGSGNLRRAMARGLKAEGATISTIAALFTVSHQRVSALLRRDDRRPPV